MENVQTPAGVEFVTEASGIREYRLANGLKLLLVENRVAPVATFCVLYRVGSRNEAVGYTGSTHLLEHMMFKGTPTFNKEKNTQIAATLQKIGADFNATTWYDRTNYYETVPSDQLELAIRMEADRMRNSLIADADRQSEMTVVRNELERGQNEPQLVLDEAVYATAFREHPYHHPTIGWRADVENVPTARLKTFYNTFYHPNNATAIVVGDFERDATIALVNKYFGAYPATKDPIPEVYTDEPVQQGERRLTVRRAGELPLIQIAFHTPGVLGQTGVLSNEELAKRAANPPVENDIYPLVVLSAAMSNGVTSRLYQSLVEKELAVSVTTNADQFRDPGLFNVYVTVRPEVEAKKVEEVVLAELARVAKDGLTEAEVEKAKQQIIAQVAYNRDGTFNVASQISEAEAVADWRFYKDYDRNIARVGRADVQRVAQKYFTEDNRTVGHFIPKQANASAENGDGNGAGNVDSNGNGAQPNGLKRVSSTNDGARAFVPHGWKYYRDPEGVEAADDDEPDAGRRDGAGGSDAASAGVDSDGAHGANEINAVVEPVAATAKAKRQRQSKAKKGGSTTPQEKEQQGVSARGDKSSDAAEANTPASVGQTNFAARVKRTQLPNGATLLVLENSATPTVSIRGSLRAGAYFEPRDRPALALITADMLERGTKRRNKLELASELESVGAQVDFSADPFAVNISGRSLSKDLPRLIRILSEELREPSFPADELEKLKQQTIAAIREQQSSTSQRAYERFTQLIFDAANPFFRPSGEQLIKSITSITVEDVRRFYTEHYGGRSVILAVAGDVKTATVEQQFREAFGTFEGPLSVDINVTDPQPQAAPRREMVLLKDKANVDILIGSAAPLRREAKDYYAAALANSALGESTLSSRLGLQVRDKEGLTYGIGSRFRAPSLAAGPWYIAVSVNPNNVEQAINSATNVLRDYVKNGMRPEELADEKSSAIGSFKVSLSTNAGIAAALWNAEFYRLGPDYIDRYPQLIQAVTVAEANAAIRKYFRPEQLTVVVAGDVEAAKPTTPTIQK
ncbi:MAG TPA: pitrilysin family protein [Pyrinomonadaceae bacterium]|nr:pitrilysin family protein [Pyrinomonadaceae bacterium]